MVRLKEIDVLIASFLYIFILNFIYWYVVEYVVAKNWNIVKSLLVYLTFTGPFSILYHLITNYFFFHFKLINKVFPVLVELNNYNENFILFLRGIFFSSIIYFVVYYLKLLLEKQKSILEIEQLTKEKLEAQLAALKQQISPHFLFNSLSTLRTMVEEPNSKKFINKLSDVYRYLLNISENNLVSLKEEINFTDSYFYILKERFEDAMVLENRLPSTIENKKIPPLVIQLLIENAIKHNEASISKPLKITMTLLDEDYIVITNNIQKKITTELSTGIGLDNIKHRYQILSDKNIVVEINKNEFTVIIPIL
jgi:LytS/YehU family sensor histidine kinase